MPSLTVRLLGPLEVRLNGAPLVHLRSRKGLWLLALMALRAGREVERAWLVGTLWPDSAEPQAYASLRRTLTDLRQALGPAAECLCSPSIRTLCLDLTDTQVDVVAFDAAIARGDTASLEQAVALYGGPLLEGCPEEWIFQERQVREQAYLRALESLAAGARARGEFEAAECYLRWDLAVDPLRESAQRALMETLSAGGNSAAALLVYRALRLRLYRELRAEPDPQTTALFQKIRSEARQRAATHEAARPSSSSAGPFSSALRPEGSPRPRNRLNDLARPEQLFQPANGRLPAAFPPMRAVDLRPNNLPIQRTSLIGREREVADLQALLRHEAVGLVTLTGPGGTGKTRLGLQVAAELLDAFVDGVFFVSLAPVSNPNRVIAAIAETLHVRDAEGRSLLDCLKDAVKGKQLLLLLDNFEQVLSAAPRVAELLSACPRLKVLVTSRAVLRLRGEKVFPVPPLALPDRRSLPGVEVLSQYAAVKLFVQRAQDIQAAFAVTNENAQAIAEICHRLEGLPLAIELAAARIKLFSPQALLTRLESRLNMLAGGARDLPARQQTLRAAIAWSYDLLNAGERRLFRRLAVFVGGFPLEAVPAVCDPDGDLEVEALDGIASLVDQSLVRQEEPVDGQPRFGMLETIREYAREVLETSGEAVAIRQRHARFFLVLAEQAEPELLGPRQLAWLNRLEREHDNVRAVLGWAAETAAVEWGLRLGAALQWFWHRRSHFAEGRQWLAQLLDRAPERTAVRARALLSAGALAICQADYPAARALLDESLSISRESGDRRGVGAALKWRGAIARHEGDRGAARSLCEESLQIYRELGDRQQVADVISGLAHLQDDLQEKRALLQEALTIQRELGAPSDVANILYDLAGVACSEGNRAAARTLVEECLALWRELGDKRGMALSLSGLGVFTEDLETAYALMEESLALWRELADRRCIADTLKLLGIVARCRGNHATALDHLEESLSIAQELGIPYLIASTLIMLALTLCDAGDSPRAAAFLADSLTRCQDPGRSLGSALCLIQLAGLAAAEGWPDRAARLLGAAECRMETLGIRLREDDRAEYARIAGIVCTTLGQDAFAAAWAEGRSTLLEEAIAEALETQLTRAVFGAATHAARGRDLASDESSQVTGETLNIDGGSAMR